MKLHVDRDFESKMRCIKQTARERDINSPLRHGNQVKFSQWGTNFIPVVLPVAINFAGAHDVYNSPILIIPEVLRIPTFRAFRLSDSASRTFYI